MNNDCKKMFLTIAFILLLFAGYSTLSAVSTCGIEAKIDTETLSLKGTASYRLHNQGKFPMDRVMVYFEGESMAGHKRLWVETENGTPLQLISTDGKGIDHGFRFLLKLPRKLAPGNSVGLVFNFNRVFLLEAGEEFSLPKYWYPIIDPGYTAAFTFDVKLTAPKGMLYASSGLITKREAENGKRNRETVHFQAAPCLFFYIDAMSPKEWKKITLDADGIEVKAFWKSDKWEIWMKRFAEIAVNIIKYDKKEFGFFPGKSLCILPGSMRATGGGPVAPNVIAIHDVSKLKERAQRFSQWIVAHEIGHQYWGEYVLSGNPGHYTDSWLSIGLGFYVDRHYTYHKGLNRGKKSVYHNYREYLNATRKGLNTTVIVADGTPRDPKVDRNNMIVHSKGYAIVAMLEALVGPETFRKAIDECFSTYASKAMATADFKGILEKYSQRDLSWFFHDWLETSKTVSYALLDKKTTQKGDAFETKITLSNCSEIRMPVPVKVEYEDGSSQQKWTDRETDFPELSFTSKSPVKKVMINPGDVLAMIEKPLQKKSVPPAPRTLKMLRKAMKDRPLVKKIIDAVNNYSHDDFVKAAVFFKEALEKDISNSNVWHILGISLYDSKRYEDGIKAFEKMAVYASARQGIAYVWLGQLNDLLGNRKKAVDFYNKALLAGVPYAQYGQWKITMNDAYVQQLLKKPYDRKGH